MVRPPDPRLVEFLSAYDRAIVDLSLALREIVLEEAPDAVEAIYDAYNAVAVGFSYTGRLKETFCHIATYTHHVNLGFNRGASLPDPKNVLVGKGTSVRHIKISNVRELSLPYLRTFLRAAIEQVGGSPEAGVRLPKSVVRGNYPKKRRPAR